MTTPTTPTSQGQLHRVLCGGALGLYQMAYREWGDPNNPNVLVCVHGLTRNSLDFERLAQSLSAKYRVIAPDVVGRGECDFLQNPMAYNTVTYAADMITLLAKLGVEQVDWLGTSMGGLIGMMLASQPKIPPTMMIRIQVSMHSLLLFAASGAWQPCGIKTRRHASCSAGRTLGRGFVSATKPFVQYRCCRSYTSR